MSDKSIFFKLLPIHTLESITNNGVTHLQIMGKSMHDQSITLVLKKVYILKRAKMSINDVNQSGGESTIR